ncbi:MAG: hypothetical protein HZB54_05280 [Deltaproteobacteria bacterium]|nr:hypothetical protein [Deltaproteobacteria bacterium]
MKFILHSTALLTAAFLIFLSYASAQQSSFRSAFIINYIGNNFVQQVELVKKNKDILPEEIKSLMADAIAPDKTYEQKMYFLNLANAMASMHKYWNNDDKPLTEIETILRIEVQKEKERAAELEKWKKYEKFIGNIVMKEHRMQMEAAGLNPVVFPHWLHRIWFQCKVCHQDIFIMKKGGNDISQAHLSEGKQCAVCHNGKLAFGADEMCEKCHNAGRPGIESLYDMTKIDHKKIKDIAEHLGAEWNHENLPKGKAPIDRFGYINWLELKAKNVFKPINSLNKDFKDEVRDNKILFESASPMVNNVLFDHKIHSTWIQCSTCHPSIFADKLGENRMKMTDMAAGKYCGHCHGKVSFTFADCLRCHNIPKGEIVKDALIHKVKP